MFFIDIERLVFFNFFEGLNIIGGIFFFGLVYFIVIVFYLVCYLLFNFIINDINVKIIFKN